MDCAALTPNHQRLPAARLHPSRIHPFRVAGAANAPVKQAERRQTEVARQCPPSAAVSSQIATSSPPTFPRAARDVPSTYHVHGPGGTLEHESSTFALPPLATPVQPDDAGRHGLKGLRQPRSGANHTGTSRRDVRREQTMVLSLRRRKLAADTHRHRRMPDWEAFVAGY